MPVGNKSTRALGRGASKCDPKGSMTMHAVIKPAGIERKGGGTNWPEPNGQQDQAVTVAAGKGQRATGAGRPDPKVSTQ